MMLRPALRQYRTWTSDSRRWDAYRPRQGDILVATYPKSGTTWMQQIVGLLVFASPEPRPIGDISPWFDRRFAAPVDEVNRLLDSQSHRRFIKCHTPFDGMPLHDEVKYIHVARDGRDACLSFHNHSRSLREQTLAAIDRTGLEDPLLAAPQPRPPVEPREFFHRWMTQGVAPESDGLPFVSWFNFEATYWQARQQTNLLCVHYRDLKADLEGEMRRIAKFLDIEIPQGRWPALVTAATFGEMRKAAEATLPSMMKLFEGGAGGFFHKGENDRWKGVLSDADLALFDAACRARLSPACAAWLANGRLASTEPRTAAD